MFWHFENIILNKHFIQSNTDPSVVKIMVVSLWNTCTRNLPLNPHSTFLATAFTKWFIITRRIYNRRTLPSTTNNAAYLSQVESCWFMHITKLRTRRQIYDSKRQSSRKTNLVYRKPLCLGDDGTLNCRDLSAAIDDGNNCYNVVVHHSSAQSQAHSHKHFSQVNWAMLV